MPSTHKVHTESIHSTQMRLAAMIFLLIQMSIAPPDTARLGGGLLFLHRLRARLKWGHRVAIGEDASRGGGLCRQPETKTRANPEHSIPMPRDSHEQLVHFLSDMYSVEQQALAQLASAPEIAGDEEIAEDLRRHLVETEEQAEIVGGRLQARGGAPSVLKDAIMKLGGKGFLLFALALPETPGRLAAHCYSYEAMEWAGYELLKGFAAAAGDGATEKVAVTLGAQERAMMEQLEYRFDAAEEASHGGDLPEDLPGHVRRHLAEAHALESQGISFLEKGEKIAGESVLSAQCARQRADAERHAKLLEDRLRALGDSPSAVEDVALAAGGWNWGLFFQAQADTPAKLAAFAFAFEHLKVAGYELLRRTAKRAGDETTAILCEGLAVEEREMADRFADTFPAAVEATLAAVGP